MRAITLVLGLVGLVLAASGCNGASCASVCDRQEDLGCGSPSCVSSCEDGRREASRIGCSSEYANGLSCAQTNACDFEGACRDAQAELVGCIAAFCTRNPTDTVCTGAP